MTKTHYKQENYIFKYKFMSKSFFEKVESITNTDNTDNADNTDNNNSYTPETIAWKLLMDSDLEKLQNRILDVIEFDEDDDPVSFQYEILLTILMEMIYGVLQINYYSNLQEEEELFEPKFTKKDIEDNLDFLKEKFLKIGILLNIQVFDINSDDRNYLNNIIRKSYCRVALRYSEKDKQFFQIHSNKIPSEKNYWFINNQTYQKQTKINKIIGTCIFDDTFCSIKFSPCEL